MRRGLIVFILLAAAETAHGQFLIGSGYSATYDDNINNNALHLTDRISRLDATAGYGWEGGSWSLRSAYDGTLSYFHRVIERTNQYHAITLAGSLLTDAESENQLSFDLAAGAGYFHDGYALYDHTGMAAEAQYKHFLTDNLLGRIGYALRTIAFAELSDFSYTEHAAMSQLALALPTGTTLIAQGEIGAKTYARTIRSGDGSLARGNSGPDVLQLSGLLKAGQRLAETTGLSLSARYLWNIAKESRYLVTEDGFISDDELFDDHYGYEGAQAQILLTQIVSERLTLRLSAGLQEKRYTSLPAYDPSGVQSAERRADFRTQIRATFRWRVPGTGFILAGSYDHIRNSSNDPFYDYANNAMALGLELPIFPFGD